MQIEGKLKAALSIVFSALIFVMMGWILGVRVAALVVVVGIFVFSILFWAMRIIRKK